MSLRWPWQARGARNESGPEDDSNVEAARHAASPAASKLFGKDQD